MLLTTLYRQTASYHFLILLLLAILLGGLTGHIMGAGATKLKPLGDIFINLIFTAVVPLVFFSIASAIASIGELRQIGKIMTGMLGTFLFTSLIAAIFMLVLVKLYPPAQGVFIQLNMPAQIAHTSLGTQLVNMFTVPDFIKLFSRENMLALIFFAGLIGLATAHIGEKAKIFAEFLQTGTDISMTVVSFIMYYAPIGFFAYFAVLVGELGPKLLETYFRATLVYYLGALLYFIVAYTFYAYLAAKKSGIKLFWRNIFLPATTALATCSSAASIPANLQATRKMGVPPEIYELVVPLGGIIHKDGSVMGGIVKIAFLFGIFHMNFNTPSVLLMALLISLLVGTVMGAIPSGGMIGEMLILSVYGFPPQALIIIAAISMIIDPPATLISVTSNSACSMLVARLLKGPKWLKSPSQVLDSSELNR